MNDRPDTPGIEGIAKQVEMAVKTGQADKELTSTQEVRQAAIKDLIKAERVDPKKLRRSISL